MKTTSDGRRPQHIKSWISQQPLIGSYSNLKLKLRGPNQNRKCLKWRRPPMEDELKILKAEYFSNHWLDLPQISNLSSGTKPESRMLLMKTTSNWKLPQNMKSWICQQPLIGCSSNFKLYLRGPIQDKNAWNEDYLKWKIPQNIKIWISQQPLIGSSSNFKLNLRDQTRIKNAFNEDDLQWKTTSKY